jgi:hypothetical protein
MTEQPILITGCARSGTSLIAGIVHKCGAFGGVFTPATPANKRGMFENLCLRRDNVKPMFKRGLKADPKAQYPLPTSQAVEKLFTDKFIDAWRKRVIDVMIAEGYQDGPWFYKDATMGLVWPLWVCAFPNAKWILVRRAADCIVDSVLNVMDPQRKRGPSYWHSWVRSHLACFDLMKEAGANMRELWSYPIVKGDLWELRQVLDWCGLELNDEARSFIAPDLYHYREK